MADQPDVLAEVLPADRVPVVRPDGTLTSVKKERYETALANGYKFQTPDQQTAFQSQLKYGDRPAAAALAGAARGFTLGASDPVAAKLGIVPRETLEGLKQENPGASTAGDIAGTAASLAVPGLGEVSGPGIVAKLGARAVERAGVAGAETLGKKVLGRALAGGVEGSLYGAANAADESYLGDTQLTAESLMAHAGLGAVLGAPVSVAGGAAGDTLAKAGSIGDFLEGKAEDFGAKAIGGIQSSFKGMEKDEIRAIARDVMDSGIISKTDRATDILPKIQAAKQEAGAAIGDVLKTVDADRPAGFDFQRLDMRLKDFKAGLNEAEKDIIGPRLDMMTDQLERTAARAGGFEHVNDIKSTMQGEINYKADAAAKLKLQKQAVGILRDEIDTQLKAITLPEEFARFQKAKQLYGSFSEAEKWGRRGVKALMGNRAVSLTDYISGAGIGNAAAGILGGPAGAVAGAVGALGNKTLRERGPSLVANALDAIADNPGLAYISEALQKAVQAAPQRFGDYGTALAEAASKGPAETLLTHVNLANGDPKYRATVQSAGLTPEPQDEHRASLDRAAALSELQGHMDDHQDELDHHLSQVLKGERKPHAAAGVLKSQDFGAKRMRRDTSEAHRQRVEEVRQLAADPQALIDRTSANIGPVTHAAPGVAAAMTSTAHRAVTYLAQSAQQPPKAGPLAPQWHTTDAERHDFAQKLEVVQDPMSALRHAAAGTLNSAQIGALNAVYPSLARNIADTLLERIAASPKGVPYSARLMVALLTKTDPDGTMGSAAVAANQAAIHAASQKPSNTGTPGGPKAPLTVAQRSAMPGEKREMGAET